MCVVGATTTTRATRPADSRRWATCTPRVVLPAAGVAEARKLSPSWRSSAAIAATCHLRRGRPSGHGGRGRERAAEGEARTDMERADWQGGLTERGSHPAPSDPRAEGRVEL